VLRVVRNSISAKLYGVVLAAVACATIIMAVVNAWVQATGQIESRQAETRAIAKTMATAIAPAVADRDSRAIATTLSAMRRFPAISYATVLDADGRRVFQYGIGITIDHFHGDRPANEKLSPLSALHLGTTVIRAPVVRAGRQVGSLVMVADLSDLRNALLKTLLMSLSVGALAGAVSVMIAAFLQRAITGPIRALTRSMEHVRNTHDFAHTAERQSSDETGLLTDAFNEMLEQILRRDQALEKHRDELEVTVQRRTSDMKEAMAAAEAANEAKSEFLATMSHEIRTPLNGMLVMAELVAASELSPKTQRYADVIVNSGRSLLAIINDILDLSKIEAGKLELERVRVEPRRLVDDVLRLFSGRANADGLELAAFVGGDVPDVIAADPVRLNQVLTNLISNALKFTTQGGVTVNVARTSVTNNQALPRLIISVTDTGIGIAPEKCEQIFDAFRQAEQSTTRKFGGTGIGLSICKRLVEAMGGEITVSSVIGKGATFVCDIPCVIVEEPKAVRPHQRTPVAVVEMDDGLTLQALTSTLADHGFDVVGNEDRSAPRADVAFWDLDRLIAYRSGNLAGGGAIDAPVVAIGPFGDPRGGHVVAEGLADCLLDRPLPTADLERVLATVLEAPDPKAALKPTGAKPNAQETQPSFAGTHVLAADDNPVNREILTEVMRRFDVTLTTVEDGLAAVEAAKSPRFDLIFMDVSMPGVDGLEATRRIRDWEREGSRRRTPIIAVTAHSAGDSRRRWREAGMDDFVTKPFSLAVIEGCLKKWLEPSRADAGGQTPVDAMHVPVSGSDRAGRSADQMVDWNVLKSIAEIEAPGDGLVDRVLGMYATEAPQVLARLTGGKRDADLADVAAAAHMLKSLSRNIGAEAVAMLADVIELEAETGERLPDAQQLQALSETLERTVALLSTVSRSRPAGQNPETGAFDNQVA
jgi:signal transduction histidine kinase/CheY-like chemotaxis protein